MLTTRWNPLLEMQSEMNRLRSEMDRVFGRQLSNGRQSLASAEYPAINLWEDAENLYLETELPGMGVGDLELYVNAGTQLTIKGDRRAPDCGDATWHRRERGFGKFAKTIELPNPVDENRVQASFKLGVLTVTLPKSEKAKPRRIEVKAD